MGIRLRQPVPALPGHHPCPVSRINCYLCNGNRPFGWAGSSALPGQSIGGLTIPPAAGPVEPEVYVSYAWAGERQDPLVGELCDALAKQGLYIGRDSTDQQPGDRISYYMGRLSEVRCVVVVLSEAYLRSEFCMTELYHVYAKARHQDDEFLRRIVPLVQDDARIGTPHERIAHAVYWKDEHDRLDSLIREPGGEVVGVEDFRRFKLIGEFFRHVGDILAYANGVLVSRDRPSPSREGFALVKKLIDQALAYAGKSV